MKTKIYAHRGYSWKYPENTILAFKKAIELGADGIETDVQMTKDGELVLLHDEKIDRTSDGTGYVKDFTLQELRERDFGSWKGEEFRETKIPLLEELLVMVKESGIELNIEIKNNIIKYSGIENKIIDMVRKYGIEKDVIISSFNHEGLKRIIQEHEDIKCGALIYSTLINPENYILENKFYSIHPMYMSLSKSSIMGIKSKGIPIYPYTVDIEEHMELLKKSEIECIITNRVDIALKVINR